jgi:hypothetical protein
MDYSGRLLLEAIQREALIVLFKGLNNKIDSLNETWQIEDDEILNTLGRGNSTWTVEEIPDDNFYSGTIPSLINASINKYPNCSVICYISEPKRSSDDIGENYTDILAVEIMVKSGPYDQSKHEERFHHEQQSNSRIQKTLDAAHLTILDNRNLNNTIPDLPAPRVSVGDIFIRTEEKGRGNKWCWQGGSLEYDLDKYISLA